MKDVIIAVTGTPGTGKTTVAPIIADELGLQVVDLNDLLRDDYVLEKDVDRDSFVVDIEAAVNNVELSKDCVIDGHLSHFFSVDKVVVLRCRPAELLERLKSKGWSRSKIRENIEAEAMDVISDEARRKNDDVTDVDTTGDSPEGTAKKALHFIEGRASGSRLNFMRYLEDVSEKL